MAGVLRRGALIAATLLLAVAAGGAGASTGTADGLLLCIDTFPGLARLGCCARAIVAGPWAASSNPALMTRGISASGGSARLSSTSLGLGAGFSLGGDLTGGATLRWLGHGGLTGRDEVGEVTGEYSWSAGSAMAGLSLGLAGGLVAGVAGGPLWESAGDVSATGLSGSAGLCWTASPSLSAGCMVTGLGMAPDWDGIRKDMPVEATAAVLYSPPGMLLLTCGATAGPSTAARLSAAAQASLSGFSVSGGWEAVPGEERAGGPFAGASYTYSSSGTYTLDASVSRSETGWPVSAGITASF